MEHLVAGVNGTFDRHAERQALGDAVADIEHAVHQREVGIEAGEGHASAAGDLLQQAEDRHGLQQVQEHRRVHHPKFTDADRAGDPPILPDGLDPHLAAVRADTETEGVGHGPRIRAGQLQFEPVFVAGSLQLHAFPVREPERELQLF